MTLDYNVSVHLTIFICFWHSFIFDINLSNEELLYAFDCFWNNDNKDLFYCICSDIMNGVSQDEHHSPRNRKCLLLACTSSKLLKFHAIDNEKLTWTRHVLWRHIWDTGSDTERLPTRFKTHENGQRGFQKTHSTQLLIRFLCFHYHHCTTTVCGLFSV